MCLKTIKKLKQIKTIMSDLLLVESKYSDGTNIIRPIKNTTKTECYKALFEIQELLNLRGRGE